MSKKLFLLLVFSTTITFLSAQENTALLCADGIDNDGDGLIDCADEQCQNLPNEGCLTCFGDGLSFADEVIFADSACANENTHLNAQTALGVSDYFLLPDDTYISLGDGGMIILGFSNNVITNSGDTDADVYVFEGGTVAEPFMVALRPYDVPTVNNLFAAGLTIDADGFFEFSQLAGFTSSLDIDLFASGYAAGDLKFDAIKITDLEGACNGATPGAEIDAVCALSSIALDCNGILGGMAMIDICGLCLEPTDPLFNTTCLDCNGTPNGDFILDNCGDCLLPDDSLFNQACAQRDIFIPNVFSPNADGINDVFRIFKYPETKVIIRQFSIFNRWGGQVFSGQNLEFSEATTWWQGFHQGQRVETGLFAYFVEVEFADGETRRLEGDVLVVF